MDKVIHFKIPYKNKENAFKFYTKLFRWKLQYIPEMEYTILHTAIIDKNNIVNKKSTLKGGLFHAKKAGKELLLVIGAQSVDKTVNKVISAGGKLIASRKPIPEGSYERIADWKGNVSWFANETK
jgi:predicted enzyme related to lactoylglutathione lyase